MINVGEIIKFLRVSQKVTQNQLANFLGCSREFISQVERGHRLLPSYFIPPLSNFLNYDIKTLIKNSDKYTTFEHYMLSYKLIDCIDNKDNLGLAYLLKNEIIINEFNYGSPKILKLYSTALVEKYINNNIDKSVKICLDLLELSSKTDIQNFHPQFYKEYFYYSAILVLGSNLNNEAEYETLKILLSNTLDFLEDNIFNSAFPNSSISYFFKNFTYMY